MRVKVISLVLIGALLALAPAAYGQRKGEKTSVAAAAPAPAHGNADYISAQQLKDYLAFIASDEMEGRDTPSRGLDTAARFIASCASPSLAAPSPRNVSATMGS